MDFELENEQLYEVDDAQIQAESDFFEAGAMDGLEKAPSMEIQAEEISEVFLEHPELNFENWQELSVEERAEALQGLENEIAAIEHRDALPVVAEEMEAGMYGYFSQDDMQIHLNTAFLESNEYGDYAETMDTLFHEGRHAYQFENVSGNVVEQNSEYVEAWSKNFDEGDWGYHSADIYGFDDYYMQPVEVDARAFASAVREQIGI